MKRPVVVAIANVLLPGLGYILLGKRKIFGFLLVLNSLITWAWLIIYPQTETPGMWGPLEFNSLLGIVAVALLAAAFAYDAYTLAKK